MFIILMCFTQVLFCRMGRSNMIVMRYLEPEHFRVLIAVSFLNGTFPSFSCCKFLHVAPLQSVCQINTFSGATFRWYSHRALICDPSGVVFNSNHPLSFRGLFEKQVEVGFSSWPC